MILICISQMTSEIEYILYVYWPFIYSDFEVFIDVICFSIAFFFFFFFFTLICRRLEEKEMAAHSSILAWRILWAKELGGLLSMGLHRVGHNWRDLACMHWRREWQPTPVFLPGESQGQRSLVGCHFGVAQNWTWLKWLSSSSRRFYIIPYMSLC